MQWKYCYRTDVLDELWRGKSPFKNPQHSSPTFCFLLWSSEILDLNAWHDSWTLPERFNSLDRQIPSLSRCADSSDPNPLSRYLLPHITATNKQLFRGPEPPVPLKLIKACWLFSRSLNQKMLQSRSKRLSLSTTKLLIEIVQPFATILISQNWSRVCLNK